MGKRMINVDELIETIQNSDCIVYHDGGATANKIMTIIHNFAIDKCGEDE